MESTILVPVEIGGVRGFMAKCYNGRNRKTPKEQRALHPFLRNSKGQLKPVDDPDYSHSGYAEHETPFTEIAEEIKGEGLLPRGHTVVPCVAIFVPVDQVTEVK